ncbi:MAG: hypothetical protein JST82_05395 [Bacteroidetes bacterium]|nr:hypothetical protein [Bacteroidota bacterium]
MYVKNQQFNDEDTLFEVLFDFEIGEPSPYMQGIVTNVTKAMDADTALSQHLQTMEEEDRLELYDDIKREQIVNILRQSFQGFAVNNACFYGISAQEKLLLYSIDLY